MMRDQDVTLTPLREADSPLLFAWINDREQVLHNAPYRPVQPEQHRQWFERVQQRDDIAIFAIRLRQTDQLIGTCQLHSIHPVHRSAELQIRIGDVSARGRGYGTQAVRLLLRFGFADLNLHRIGLHVFETNLAALRVYEKAGFSREGLLRGAAFIDGAFVNVVVMGILRDDFQQA